MIAMMLIIVGALNWLLIGLFDFNIVNALFGKSIIARAVYVIIGLAALAICVTATHTCHFWARPFYHVLDFLTAYLRVLQRNYT